MISVEIITVVKQFSKLKEKRMKVDELLPARTQFCIVLGLLCLGYRTNTLSRFSIGL